MASSLPLVCSFVLIRRTFEYLSWQTVRPDVNFIRGGQKARGRARYIGFRTRA